MSGTVKKLEKRLSARPRKINSRFVEFRIRSRYFRDSLTRERWVEKWDKWATRVADRPESRIPLGSYVCEETAATIDHLLQLRLLRLGRLPPPLASSSSPPIFPDTKI